MDILRALVRREPCLFTYDNMHVSTSIFTEQREDGPVKVLTGTAFIIYALRNATWSARLLAPILARRDLMLEITYAEERKNMKSLVRSLVLTFMITFN